VVFFDSSVLVNVPSGDSVTVFSVDLTVPLLLTLLVLLWETSWAHPTNRNDNAKADVATHITAMRFMIICFMVVFLSFARATMLPGARQRTLSAGLPPSNTLQVLRHQPPTGLS
jgi:hypothetical protein